MTDKELRKLSRLELLELLLEQSKENEKLKSVGQSSSADSAAEAYREQFSAVEIQEISRKIDDSFEKLSAMIETIKNSPAVQNTASFVQTGKPADSVSPPVYNAPVYQQYRAPQAYTAAPVYAQRSDEWLFRSMMNFFSKNDELLLYMPEEISKEIRRRIHGRA